MALRFGHAFKCYSLIRLKKGVLLLFKNVLVHIAISRLFTILQC